MWLVCGQATFMIMRDLQCILYDIETDQVRSRVAPFAPFATISPTVRSYFEQCNSNTDQLWLSLCQLLNIQSEVLKKSVPKIAH